ncbi:alanine acetyltransferase [Pontibacillus halophilus JSM 076056 = DSM 19796]|uniref:Alanine acetyltransferase n=1 Tax=Pontibacillus halophilus JSM 076056 = DSM 19796 TaxID=1385510 RepID=A0A0A5GLA2_9BACI|nr:GNAT family protein [Pontibacillus halophilus]KGX94026.1 alanine acetyltransferase [Pontibacillus halophilus JSM 076056 = DSM 19796]
MLKKRDLHDCPALYDLLVHPSVFPYVRHKANSTDEYYFVTRKLLEAEDRGELVSRTIVDEWNQPIGTINLFDIYENKGFLATWLGKEFHGKGYNQPAKEAFFEELFFELGIEVIFMKIRSSNIRSQKAASKLPYAILANDDYPDVYEWVNRNENTFDLYAVTKENYLFHYDQTTLANEEEAQEA